MATVDIGVQTGYPILFRLIFPHTWRSCLAKFAQFSNFMRISLFTHFVMFSPGLTSLPLSCYQFVSFFPGQVFQIANFRSGNRHQNEKLAKDESKQFSPVYSRDSQYTKAQS